MGIAFSIVHVIRNGHVFFFFKFAYVIHPILCFNKFYIIVTTTISQFSKADKINIEHDSTIF
jgi:hypothetical protein